MNSENYYKVAWKSPANIALVKYWGKQGNQLPKNPSISLTLKDSVTTMSMTVKKSSAASLKFFFEKKANEKFQHKISKFLTTQYSRFPWLAHSELEIYSENTFPHSSGIASSASSMSALALCLISMDQKLSGINKKDDAFFKESSTLSRLASGSASRSVYGGVVSWGVESDEWASPSLEMNSLFSDYCDSILIVDDTEKSVSSRAGHSLMETHPFAEKRFTQAKENLVKLKAAMINGDLEAFITIVEEEALTLHSLMMTSRPSYILLKPQSLWLIEAIKNFRETTKIPVCFTIDAGPNIHLLYPKAYATKVRAWIEQELAEKLVGKKWIHDQVGNGPEEIL